MKSIHGGDIYNNKVNMDFSVNINPLGIPHSVKEAMSDALSYADRYPDMACSGLKKDDIRVFHTARLQHTKRGCNSRKRSFRAFYGDSSCHKAPKSSASGPGLFRL